MSLLMQALKKAERAKQSHAADEELAKPSEAFDEKLALAPQPPAPHRELELELAALTPGPPRTPLDLSLEPFDAASVAPTAAGAAADSAEPPPAPAAHQAPHEPNVPREPVRTARNAAQEPRHPAHNTAQESPQHARNAPPGPRNTPPSQQTSRTAIRRPSSALPDPRIVRALTLAGFVLLAGAVFGYIYWRAVYGPGSSRNVPMVPMPGQDIPPAAAPGDAAQVYPPASTAPASAQTTPASTAFPQAPAGTGPAPIANYVPPAGPPASYPAAQGPAAAPIAATPSAPPAAASAKPSSAKTTPAATAPNAEEEIRRIAQENLERAEHMQRILDTGDPNRPSGPPPPPYVPPPEATAPAAAAVGTAPGAVRASPAAAPAAQPAYASPAQDSSSGIRVARSSKPEQVNPGLLSGYSAFNRGDFGAAHQQYRAVLQQDPNNRDALLGNAALALQERQPDQAAAIYARLLDLDPNDGDALAGLAGLRGGDPAQTEGRLRRALAQSPESAALLFALGNLYARQGRWQEAQQQYFKAFTNAPNNPDYAFNLAIGLDRLGQRKLALGYYQRALSLAAGAPANFDRNAAAGRIRALGGQ
ncbi:MAG TPA: tetratricopeptide repeat protein [Telluria sp.]|nr:tetratricopeptide repeat protein [Telluria sp.]